MRPVSIFSPQDPSDAVCANELEEACEPTPRGEILRALDALEETVRSLGVVVESMESRLSIVCDLMPECDTKQAIGRAASMCEMSERIRTIDEWVSRRVDTLSDLLQRLEL